MRMECSRIRAILFENAGADIPMEVRDKVEAHVAGCKSCEALAHALERQSHALRDMPRMEAPPDLLAKVRMQVQKPPLHTVILEKLAAFFSGRQFFRLAGVAATAVLVVVMSRIVLQEGEKHKAQFSPAPTAVEAPAPMQGELPAPSGDMAKENLPKEAMGGAAPPEPASPPGFQSYSDAPQKSAELTPNIPGPPRTEDSWCHCAGPKE